MNEEIRGLLNNIMDLKSQLNNLYMDALELRSEFDTGSPEYYAIDAAMDHIDDAETDLQYGIEELNS